MQWTKTLYQNNLNNIAFFFTLCKGDRVFSHDVTVAILVSQNNEKAAMLVSQTNPLVVNSFLMQTLSFVPIGCAPRKHSIDISNYL